MVTGAYDFPYNVAAEGNLHTAGISYHWPVDWGWLKGITAYNEHSYLNKAESGFDNIHHNVTGLSFDASPFFIYAGVAVGQNNAWIGPDFSDALGPRGTDNDLH